MQLMWIDLLNAQAIRLSFFPRFRITHTSEKHPGQIYIAIINYVRLLYTLSEVVQWSYGLCAEYLHACADLDGLDYHCCCGIPHISTPRARLRLSCEHGSGFDHGFFDAGETCHFKLVCPCVEITHCMA